MDYTYISLGSLPCNEEPYDAPANPELDRAVCQLYRAQLERQFPILSDLPARYRIRTNADDFGSYREVEIGFDPDDEQAATFALRVEAGAPTEWDDEAREALIAWKLAHGYGLSAGDLGLDFGTQSFGPRIVLLEGQTGFVISSDGNHFRICAHHDRAAEVEDRPPAPGIALSTTSSVATRTKELKTHLMPKARAWWQTVAAALEHQRPARQA